MSLFEEMLAGLPDAVRERRILERRALAQTAMLGMLASGKIDFDYGSRNTPDALVPKAYMIADAMLEQEKK